MMSAPPRHTGLPRRRCRALMSNRTTALASSATTTAAKVGPGLVTVSRDAPTSWRASSSAGPVASVQPCSSRGCPEPAGQCNAGPPTPRREKLAQLVGASREDGEQGLWPISRPWLVALGGEGRRPVGTFERLRAAAVAPLMARCARHSSAAGSVMRQRLSFRALSALFLTARA